LPPRWPAWRPADQELLASLGVDLGVVHTRLQEAFGENAYWDTAQRVRHRATPVPTPAGPHRPLAAGLPARDGLRRVGGDRPRLRRLVEAEGRTLEGLREALLEAMDRPADRPP
jgi:hypothetical protein